MTSSARLLGAGVAMQSLSANISPCATGSPLRNSPSPPPSRSNCFAALAMKCPLARTRAALEDPDRNGSFSTRKPPASPAAPAPTLFSIGLAWWDAGGLQVEQLFLRDFSEEHSLLQELAARIAERPVLVTFNGKSFDWPLLESRFTMTRAIAASATCRASRFASSRARALEASPRLRAPRRTRAPRPRCVAPRLASRRRRRLCADPAILFRLSSRRPSISARRRR